MPLVEIFNCVTDTNSQNWALIRLGLRHGKKDARGDIGRPTWKVCRGYGDPHGYGYGDINSVPTAAVLLGHVRSFGNRNT